MCEGFVISTQQTGNGHLLHKKAPLYHWCDWRVGSSEATQALLIGRIIRRGQNDLHQLRLLASSVC